MTYLFSKTGYLGESETIQVEAKTYQHAIRILQGMGENMDEIRFTGYGAIV